MKNTWADPSIYLDQIFIEKSCASHPYAAEIAERSGLPVALVEPHEFHLIVSGQYPDNLGVGKKKLLLCRNSGAFLKDCPGTREYRCCDYRIINVGLGCPMDCVYCILQAYLNTPYLSFFINIEDMFTELGQKIDGFEGDIMRIGTGEFTDSMALDRITGLSRHLVTFFAAQKKAVLELKTKSANIANLEHLDHNGRTIVAWSLNGQDIVASEEIRTATLEQRLDAAARVVSWGYPCAFHFDPIIAYPGWQEGYRRVIHRLYDAVPAESIKWISLGGFRYLPALKPIGTSRFGHSNIFYHEFIEGLDGKTRYFRPFRVELYKTLYRELKCFADQGTCIYFCMESDQIWQEVMGYVPSDRGGLGTMLDNTVRL
jgi:spore photoproduct lyase